MRAAPLQTADVPLFELRRMLEDTERGAGPESQAARILRRVINRREQQADDARHARRRLASLDSSRGADQ